MGYRAVTQITPSRTAVDTDPALRIWYNDRNAGSSGGTATVTLAGTTMTIVANGTTTALSLATYTTIGALADAINALDDNLYCTIGAALRADVISTDATLIDQTVTDIKISTVSAGVPIYFLTSSTKHVTLALGMEDVASINGVTLNAFERRMSNKTGPTRDPGYLDSTSQFVSRVPDRAPRLNSITGVITFGSGAMTVTAYKCAQDYDGAAIPLRPVTTTAVGQSWSAGTDLPTEGIVGSDGERIVVRFYNSSAAPTAPTLTLLGDVGVLS